MTANLGNSLDAHNATRTRELWRFTPSIDTDMRARAITARGTTYGAGTPGGGTTDGAADDGAAGLAGAGLAGAGVAGGAGAEDGTGGLGT